MEREGVVFSRLNEAQAVINQWELAIIPEPDRTEAYKVPRMLQEVEEVKSAFNAVDGSPEAYRALADEITDVIIGALGVLNSLGYDAERLLEEKINLMYQKYNPAQNGHLQQNGHSWKEAMATQKASWPKP